MSVNTNALFYRMEDGDDKEKADLHAAVIAVVRAAETFLGNTATAGDTVARRRLRREIAALPQQQPRDCCVHHDPAECHTFGRCCDKCVRTPAAPERA